MVDIVTEYGFVQDVELVYQGQRKTADYHSEMGAETFERYPRIRQGYLKQLNKNLNLRDLKTQSRREWPERFW